MSIETGTSQKHRYELIKASLLVIVGALITLTIVYGVPYFTPKDVSTPIESVTSNTQPTSVMNSDITEPAPTQDTSN